MGSRICSTYSVRHSASPNHSLGRVSIAYILRPISASCIVSLAWFSPSCRTISSISSSSPPVAPKEPHRVSAGPDDPALVPCARPRRLVLAMCRSMRPRPHAQHGAPSLMSTRELTPLLPRGRNRGYFKLTLSFNFALAPTPTRRLRNFPVPSSSAWKAGPGLGTPSGHGDRSRDVERFQTTRVATRL